MRINKDSVLAWFAAFTFLGLAFWGMGGGRDMGVTDWFFTTFHFLIQYKAEILTAGYIATMTTAGILFILLFIVILVPFAIRASYILYTRVLKVTFYSIPKWIIYKFRGKPVSRISVEIKPVFISSWDWVKNTAQGKKNESRDTTK